MVPENWDKICAEKGRTMEWRASKKKIRKQILWDFEAFYRDLTLIQYEPENQSRV